MTVMCLGAHGEGQSSSIQQFLVLEHSFMAAADSAVILLELDVQRD